MKLDNVYQTLGMFSYNIIYCATTYQPKVFYSKRQPIRVIYKLSHGKWQPIRVIYKLSHGESRSILDMKFVYERLSNFRDVIVH